jgi:hypothetical protein
MSPRIFPTSDRFAARSPRTGARAPQKNPRAPGGRTISSGFEATLRRKFPTSKIFLPRKYHLIICLPFTKITGGKTHIHMARFDSSPLVRLDAGRRFDEALTTPPTPGGKKRMAKPALKNKERDEAGVSQICRTLAEGLTKTPIVITTPKVTPTQLNDGADDLDEAVQNLADHDQGRAVLVQEVANKRKAAEALATQSADDSAVQTGYDKTKLDFLLVPLQSETDSAPDTSPLQNFHVSHGDHEGEVDGGCNRRKGTKIYRVRCGPSATGPWATKYEGSKSNFTITGETVGQMCYFQMQAFVGGQWTEWSDIAQLRIV